MYNEDLQGSVAAAFPVTSTLVPLAKAKAIGGLRAVFGEAYPDPVRVVAVEVPPNYLNLAWFSTDVSTSLYILHIPQHNLGSVLADPSSSYWLTNSIEFCGGTHMRNTAEAISFVITDETAVAKGVRRVVAVTREAATRAAALGVALRARLIAAEALDPKSAEETVSNLRAELDEVRSTISVFHLTLT